MPSVAFLRRAALVLILAASRQSPAQETVSPAPETVNPRLLATARLWVTVKYFHPFLAYRSDIDWDQALTSALPKIVAAKSPAEYQAALESLLSSLHDPETFARLVPPTAHNPTTLTNAASSPNDVFRSALARMGATSTFMVEPGPATRASQQILDAAAKNLVEGIDSAGSLTFDLRSRPGHDPRLLAALLDDEAVRSHVLTKPLTGASQRSWMHAGLPPETGGNLYGYYSAFLTHQAPTFVAARLSPNQAQEAETSTRGAESSITFRLGEGSVLPRIGAALVAHRLAKLEADSPNFTIAGIETVSLPMGEDVAATVRLTEYIAPDGTAIDPAHTPLASVPAPRPSQFDPAVRYPPPAQRLLAAFKTWGVLKYFFAYPDQMDEDWDNVFADALPAILNAKDARAYHLAIAAFVTHLKDSQAQVESAELSDYFGVAPPPLRLRIIDQKPVVTNIFDESARAAGIAIGDIVLKVDGEDIVERINHEAAYLSAATQQSLAALVMNRLLNGPDQSTAALVLRGTGGVQKEVKLVRRVSFQAAMSHSWREGPVLKTLPGNIGYADLDRLTSAQVDELFTMFHNAKAIIFDMRGLPRDASIAPLVASRLARTVEAPAALINGPILFSPAVPSAGVVSFNASYFQLNSISSSGSPRFDGKTVMLVDERTEGEAEKAALLFEAANHTTFIGSPSAGSNGDPSNFQLPGGITVFFSGHDIRHANSGQLQRLGLQPELLVKPSVQGIRQGRDEILERALAHLAQ